MKAFAVPSTSVEVSVPDVVAVPGVPFATPPASVTWPVLSPAITAASLAPRIVIVTVCCVPSAAVTVKVSCSVAVPVSASTAGLVLSSV